MNILACGISMQSYQWMHGSGALFSILGMKLFRALNIFCNLEIFLWSVISNSSVLFCRDIDLTEKLDYSSAVALLGYSLILSLLRAFNVKDEATRVMFAAPILAFVTTHILYLNFYELDYGKISFHLLLNICHHYTKAIWLVYQLLNF